jgi:hypothetical protein
MPHGFTRNVSAFIDDVEDDYDTNDDDLATADATTDGPPTMPGVKPEDGGA